MATPSVTDEITAALQQFQAYLTPNQKVQFSTSQSPSPSDANGVLAFTVEVDALKQRRRARCVASRVQGTLQSVQQITSIVTTFVNSNPSVAALVWGSIRVTILAASNWSSFSTSLRHSSCKCKLVVQGFPSISPFFQSLPGCRRHCAYSTLV